MLNAADIAALHGPDDDAAARVLQSTTDLDALFKAWAFWDEKARVTRGASAYSSPEYEQARQRANAISYRMNQIRGS